MVLKQKFKKFFLNHNNKGFTLIELLVVIAIIGLLASIIAVSVNSTRAKARDARRKADLDEIYKALMLYYDDHGYLPITNTYGENGPGGWDYSSQDRNGNGQYFLEFLEPQYMPHVALDPVNDGTGDVFWTGGSGYSYAYYCYSAGWTYPNTFSLGVRLDNGTLWWHNRYSPIECQ